jgi:hypothetical protein
LISVCRVILEGVHVCRWILSFFSWFIYYLISSVAACTKNGSMCLLNAQRKQVRPILYNNITYTLNKNLFNIRIFHLLNMQLDLSYAIIIFLRNTIFIIFSCSGKERFMFFVYLSLFAIDVIHHSNVTHNKCVISQNKIHTYYTYTIIINTHPFLAYRLFVRSQLAQMCRLVIFLGTLTHFIKYLNFIVYGYLSLLL